MAISRKFRFETLLKIRRQEEDRRKRAVAVRLREIHDLEDRRQALEMQVHAHVRQLGERLRAAALDLDQVRIERHWLAQLRRGVLETQAQITAHRAILSQEQSVLSEARKNTLTFERLKERQRISWVAEDNRREQIESDDLNALRYARLSMVQREDELS